MSLDRRARLEALQARSKAASRANVQELAKDKKKKTTTTTTTGAPPTRLAKARKLVEEEEIRASGADVARTRSLAYSIEQDEAWRAKKVKKEHRFTSHEDMAWRKYERLEKGKGDLKQAVSDGKRTSRRRLGPSTTAPAINPSNERFNAKIDRYYDEYTQDIKDSLERGTAL